MNDYKLSNPPPEPRASEGVQPQQHQYVINVARNHLRHPERVSIKVLLWARDVVEQYDRREILSP